MTEIANGGAGFNQSGRVRIYRLAGWSHLHPIIPPGAVSEHRLWQLAQYHGWSAEQTAVERARRFSGKCPGALSAAGHWFPISAQDPALYGQIDDAGSERGQACLRAWAVGGAGIGVNGGWWPCLDVDLGDEREAGLARNFLGGVLGEQLFMRVGAAPRFAVPFRLAADETVRKFSVEVRPKQRGRKADQLEVIGAGAQWVLDGTHGGTGRPYEWWGRAGRRGRPAASQLPVLGLAGLQAVLEGLAAVLGLKGDVVPALGALAALAADAAPVSRELLEGPEWLVGEALDEHRNGEGVGRDRYVAVAHALVGASGEEGRETWGRALFRAWSSRHPAFDDAHDEHVWSSIKRPRSGIDWLIEEGDASETQKVGWLLALAEWRRTRSGAGEVTP